MLPVTMFNRHHPFTQGFNLIGNPYPSPIDWDSPVGWVRDHVDNALYYFNAGTTDQYTGTYSTYINGISSDGIASNIIPAMQGFFMHVSNGPPYPVAATLIYTNDVRINNLSPHFHKDTRAETRPLLRIKARFGSEGSSGDAVVIYFDNEATLNFDAKKDALKLMNTDFAEPSLYAISMDSEKLSINGLPWPDDSITMVPLGVKTQLDGKVIFNCHDLNNLPGDMFVYFCDKQTGTKQNVVLHPEFITQLNAGDHENRFSLIFSKYDLRFHPKHNEIFHVYSYRNRVYIYMSLPAEDQAELTIHNMVGQRTVHQKLQGNGYTEIDLETGSGIYIVTLRSSLEIYTKKIYINNQW